MKNWCRITLFAATMVVVQAEDRPNILWLTCEDNNVNWIGCYGNPHADTPHIDQLAKEGFQYMHCYANAPVCSPSRSTWITGVHALSTGTHQMRSRYKIPHDTIKYYPDYLKAAGYYVVNQRKTDYNIGGRDDKDPWDSMKLDWKTLKQKQPFFAVLNNTKSHESKAFGDVSKTTHSPDDVRLAAYHPDISVIRQNYAHYHDQIKKMDADIGAALKQLEAMGLDDNTIVVYNSDHGGVLARSKRYLFNSGTHCPLVIRIPAKYKKLWPAEQTGSKVDTLVSFIDMPKTWLALCGAEDPAHMQGKVFLGAKAESRETHVSYRGRMDERCDNVRAIRDQQYLFIRNYMPYAPWGQKLTYLWRMEATRAWEAHHKAGKTDAVTGRYFGTKPPIELYDASKDPDNVKNLAFDPAYAADVARLSKALDAWQREMFDSGLLPESELMKRAEACGKTVYEMIRDPKLYPLEEYLKAANLANEAEATALPKLMALLDAEDSGLRYWGMVGCFNLQGDADVDIARIRKSLDDSSHHVRIMAAWIVYRSGDKASARACLNELLRSHSYASLKILNIIDWMGEGAEPYAEAIKACKYDHGGYVKRMQKMLSIQP
jgi:N-sulfoglucosamine sulfohydrolase